MGNNFQFQNSAVTRCAKNSQICKTLPLFQSWVESVNLHKLQGPEMNILQFLRKFSQFRSWVFSANISKLQGLIEKFYHFSQLLSPFRNWTICAMSSKLQGCETKSLYLTQPFIPTLKLVMFCYFLQTPRAQNKKSVFFLDCLVSVTSINF